MVDVLCDTPEPIPPSVPSPSTPQPFLPTPPTMPKSTTPFPLTSPHTYIHLSLNNPTHSPTSTLDTLTLHTTLLTSLRRFLGETGLAIPVDILKLSEDRRAWIRVPRYVAKVLLPKSI